MMILPLLNSFPRERLVLVMADEACLTARKHLITWADPSDRDFLEMKRVSVRKSIDAHAVHKGLHCRLSQRVSGCVASLKITMR